jgi:hypothetical protein
VYTLYEMKPRLACVPVLLPTGAGGLVSSGGFISCRSTQLYLDTAVYYSILNLVYTNLNLVPVY